MDNSNTHPQSSGSSNRGKWIVGIIIVVLIILAAIFHNKQETGEYSTNTLGISSKSAANTYKIGVLLPLTGDAASYGEPAKNIYQIATEEINQTGGVNGKKIELIIEDSKCNGQDSANATQKLINVDKVQIIVGGFCSSESLAAEPIAESNKVALFSAGSSSPKLTGISHYFFRNYPSDASQGAVLADTTYNKKGFKKIAMMQEQTDYAIGINKAFSDKFQSLGGTIIQEQFATADTDFRSQLTKLKAQNSDALFLDTQTSASAKRVLKQIQDLGWKPNFVFSDVVLTDPTVLSQFKNLLEGALAAAVGVDLNNLKFAHLLAAYKAKFNTDLPFQTYAQTEYDSIYMVKDAISQVGYNGQKIADWSRTVKNWQGATGSITISANGDPLSAYSAMMIKDNKLVPFAK